MEEKDIVLYWKDGRKETIRGHDFPDAFTKAGYGHGALMTLDFFSTTNTFVWKYDPIKRKWKSVEAKANE